MSEEMSEEERLMLELSQQADAVRIPRHTLRATRHASAPHACLFAWFGYCGGPSSAALWDARRIHGGHPQHTLVVP